LFNTKNKKVEHLFNIHHAQRYGLHEAIMIKNFQFWIVKNKANKNHNHDGKTWTYNSVRAFEEIFPYLTTWQIRKCLDSLVSQGILVKGNYHKNGYERSSWYAFANESLFLDSQIDLCSTSNGIDEDNKCITDNKPNDKPNNSGGKKKFIPPSLEEVLDHFREKGYPDNQIRKAFNHYNDHDWRDSHGKKVANWKQKIQTNWFKDFDGGEFNKSLTMSKEEGDAQMFRLLKKGLDKVSSEELAWIHHWQYRGSYTFQEYSDDIRIVSPTHRVTKAQAREMNNRSNHVY